MATSSSDCSARIYDVKSDFKELVVMKGHREEVSKVRTMRKVYVNLSFLYNLAY